MLKQTWLATSILAAVLVIVPPARTNPPTGAGPRVVRAPCSLRKVCRELARRSGANVFVDPSLADQRVAWAFTGVRSLEITLMRLAELTGSRVVVRTSEAGKQRYVLEPRREVAKGEAAWRSEALLRTIRQLLRAADQQARGQLDLASFSSNVRIYVQRRAGEMKYLRLLSPEQIARLLQGEDVRLPAGAVPAAEVEALVAERYSGREEDERSGTRTVIDQEVEAVRRRGLGFRIEFDRKGAFSHLLLDIGGRGANVLCRFGDDELGLPLTRQSPYLLLTAARTKTPPPAPPALLQRPLTRDVRVSPGLSWGEVLQELAAAAGIDAVSDAYLCRIQSVIPGVAGQKALIAARGTMIYRALDLLYERFGYLWWEKDGCVFLRARAWPWDTAYETPDRFLDRWNTTLERRKAPGPAEIGVLASLTRLQLSGLANLGAVSYRVANAPGGEFREYLALFRSSSPLQQSRLLGPGLTLGPDQAPLFGALLHPLTPDGRAHPVVVRLTTPAIEREIDGAGANAVVLRLQRSWGKLDRQIDFTVRLPQLQEAFL